VIYQAGRQESQSRILGSTVKHNGQDMRFHLGFAVSDASGASGPTATPHPQLDPKGYVYIDEYSLEYPSGKEQTEPIAALGTDKNGGYLEVYHRGRTERLRIPGDLPAHNLVLLIQDNGKTVTAALEQEQGGYRELARLTRTTSLKDSSYLRAGRGGRDATITIRQLEVQAEPDFNLDLQAPRRLRTDGLADVSGRFETGLMLSDLDWFFNSVDALRVLKREARGGLVQICDNNAFFNFAGWKRQQFSDREPFFPTFPEDSWRDWQDQRRQFLDLMAEMDIEVTLWLEGNADKIKEGERKGYSYSEYVSEMLAELQGQQRKIVMGRTIDRWRNLYDKTRTASLAAQIQQAGHIPFVAFDTFDDHATEYITDSPNYVAARLTAIVKDIPAVKGIIFPAYSATIEDYDRRDALANRDRLKRAYQYVIFGGIVNQDPSTDSVCRNPDRCGYDVSVNFLLFLSDGYDIPITFYHDSGNFQLYARRVGNIGERNHAKLYRNDYQAGNVQVPTDDFYPLTLDLISDFQSGSSPVLGQVGLTQRLGRGDKAAGGVGVALGCAH